MKFLSLFALLGSLAAPAVARGTQKMMAASTFTYDTESFLLDGRKFQILGGQMDPQRVPREYWAQRLQMAKSMGLNTIFSYIYWNELEPVQGQWNFTGINDIAEWYRQIQKAGLYAVLRPGPYVCGERDWGGFPSWLSQIPGMYVRSNNEPFLDAAAKYNQAIAAQLQSAQVTRGGPLLMVQVENEYGTYGDDHNYTNKLYNILKANFEVLFYTNDAGEEIPLKNGQVPGVLAEIDGPMRSGFEGRRKWVAPESGNPGPLLNGEYYTTWFTTWGPKQAYQSLEGDTAGVNRVLDDLDYCVSDGHSFSLYMFHGGSNFGFGNGAVFPGALQPFVQSYDYGSPLDESGRPNSLYASIRQKLSEFVTDIPAVPSVPPLQTIPEFSLKPVAALFDKLPTPKASKNGPLTMERLGQSYGYVLYEYKSTARISGSVQVGELRDRVIVYVNGARKGVMDAIYANPATVNVQLKKGDKLWLLVENLGRVDYGPKLPDQRKGIVGAVKVGDTTLGNNWNHYRFPVEAPNVSSSGSKPVKTNDVGPHWYYGSFNNSKSGMAADTFMALPGVTKGVLYVNKINMGRAWIVGPQQQLYIPGAWLKQGKNDVFVLELEPGTSPRSAEGLSKRSWGNNPDPDCNNCS